MYGLGMKAFEIDNKKTVLFYLHGLRGHAFAQESALRHMLRNLGVSIISLELPGHGADSIQRHCMVPKFRHIVDDIVGEVSRRSAGAEQIILMGYSFGGSLMTLAAHKLEKTKSFEPKVAGLVGISTAFDVGHNVARWQVALVGAIAPLSRFLYRYIPDWSRFVTIREMNVDLISAEPAVIESIEADDLVYKGRIPLNTSAQVYKAGLAAAKRVNQLKSPVLLVHSLDDEIALAPKPKRLNDHITLKLFKRLRHNCIDGTSREAVVSRIDMMRFIADQL